MCESFILNKEDANRRWGRATFTARFQLLGFWVNKKWFINCVTRDMLLFQHLFIAFHTHPTPCPTFLHCFTGHSYRILEDFSPPSSPPLSLPCHMWKNLRTSPNDTVLWSDEPKVRWRQALASVDGAPQPVQHLVRAISFSWVPDRQSSLLSESGNAHWGVYLLKIPVFLAALELLVCRYSRLCKSPCLSLWGLRGWRNPWPVAGLTKLMRKRMHTAQIASELQA